MTDQPPPDDTWLQDGIAQLAAARWPQQVRDQIGNLGGIASPIWWNQAGLTALRALGTAPYALARSTQDPAGAPGAMADAATADFSGPLAGMTGRERADVLAQYLIAPIYGRSFADSFASQWGDDPIKALAKKSIERGP